MSILIIIVIFILVVVISLLTIGAIRARSRFRSIGNNLSALANTSAKLKGNIDMFRSGISPERLRRGANKNDLEYYIGYITALARCIAEADGIQTDGPILASVQMEASRLYGTSAEANGSYAEGIEILPAILTTPSAIQGLQDGDFDGHHVVDRKNPGPYFGRLRTRFDVRLPGTTGSRD